MLVNLRCFGVPEFAAGTDSREFRLCIVVIFHLCLALSMGRSHSPLPQSS